MGNDTKAALALTARLARRTVGTTTPAGWPGVIVMTDHHRQGSAIALLDALGPGAALCLRDYGMPHRAALAAQLAAKARARRVRFLVAGDPHLAIAVGAWGVHIPEGLWAHSRLTRAVARNRGLKITTAVHSAAAAHAATCSPPHQRCDAIIVSPVFPTNSHPGAKPLGPIGFRRIIGGLPVPAYALGGINPATIARLASTGAAGVAGIGFAD